MHSEGLLRVRTIEDMCRSWDGKDVDLLMTTLRRARATGFEHSFPKEEHTPLGVFMGTLNLLFERYATPNNDRAAIKEALINEVESGYRREQVKDPNKPAEGTMDRSTKSEKYSTT
jgi:hypothetical protein